MMFAVTDHAALESELAQFMGEYERANNSHDIQRVLPFLAEDTVYWFTDGSHHGIAEIRAAVEKTFATITDEIYEIRDLEWPVLGEDIAVCRYCFAWSGVVDGKRHSGQGRGTNVIVRRAGQWKMLHEHLSS